MTTKTLKLLALIGFFAFGSTSAFAACTDADLCSLEQCQQRQMQVHPACDTPRACKSTMDRGELAARRFQNELCLVARLNVSACFSVVDQNHQDQITAAGQTRDKCEALLDAG